MSALRHSLSCALAGSILVLAAACREATEPEPPSIAAPGSPAYGSSSDRKGPTKPANLHSTGNTSWTVSLAWDRSTDNTGTPLKFERGERLTTPTAIAHFPFELPLPPRPLVERVYHVVRWSEMPKGGHFAALEQPDALSVDVEDFFARLGR